MKRIYYGIYLQVMSKWELQILNIRYQVHTGVLLQLKLINKHMFIQAESTPLKQTEWQHIKFVLCARDKRLDIGNKSDIKIQHRNAQD